MKKRKEKSKKKIKSKFPFGIFILGVLSLVGLGLIGYTVYKDLNEYSLKITRGVVHEKFGQIDITVPKDMLTKQPEEAFYKEEKVFSNKKNSSVSNFFSNDFASDRNKNISEEEVKEFTFDIYLFSSYGDIKLVKVSHRIKADKNRDIFRVAFEELKKLSIHDRYVNLIPKNVQLIDYKIQGNLIILNLSQEINYNPYGAEGALGSLYQIAFTLGKLADVEKALVLVEGQEVKYLGGEGVLFVNPIDLRKFPRLEF